MVLDRRDVSLPLDSSVPGGASALSVDRAAQRDGNNDDIYAVDRAVSGHSSSSPAAAFRSMPNCLNGHAYAKRQLAPDGIAFEALREGAMPPCFVNAHNEIGKIPIPGDPGASMCFIVPLEMLHAQAWYRRTFMEDQASPPAYAWKPRVG